MKKLILGFLLIFGISSTLFAEVDFIALATNGEFNEQSAGVKVLNEEEMRQVVGGRMYQAVSLINMELETIVMSLFHTRLIIDYMIVTQMNFSL
ncbi:hypothetical protein [Helicobacter ganmani]|uniref:Bacteriocin n=1 Tax=Helicobacter ganmani TaxID=60246 RepID=A0A3D8IBI0_9HELI|nr:hypothetical protein [Helicobacter ganmani]RDU62296.1 hypothetical protein CQA43_06765 [Helicobacter ganmani]